MFRKRRKLGLACAIACLVGMLLYLQADLEAVRAKQSARLKNLSEALILAEEYIEQHAKVRRAIQDLEICDRYSNESETVKKTSRSVWTEEDTSSDDITFVTIIRVNKFHVLDLVLSHWPGPVSIALYIGESEASEVLNNMQKWPSLLHRSHIELSIVAGAFEFMPINWMRQVALDRCRTNYVALFDVDLVPSKSLYKNLKSLRQRYTNGKKVLVIPAFENVKETEEVPFPQTKAKLISYFDQNLLQSFLFTEYIPSYRSTNYSRWRTAEDIYSVQYEFGFEPYIFADKRTLPPYDTRYHGRYFNKISLFCEMQLLNFTFDVAPNNFAIHHPHPRNHLSPTHPSNFRCALTLIRPCMERYKLTTKDPKAKKSKRKRQKRQKKEKLSRKVLGPESIV